MLPKNELRPWLKSVMLIGYEDQDPQTGAEGDPGTDAGESGEDPSKDTDADELAGMRKALAAERLRNKNLQRQLKQQSSAKDDGEAEEDDSEAEEGDQEPKKPKAGGTRNAATRAAEAKLQKVTAAFVKSSFASTVRSLATNFVDPDDAVAAIDMTQITHEQDDDDPSIVVWDEAEIKTVLKDLAKRKPHFLKAADKNGAGGASKTPGRPSGSKFSGPAGKPTNPTDDGRLKDWQQRLPAMRGVRPN